MATRIPVITKPNGDDSAILVSYTGLLNGDDGAPFSFPHYSGIAVSVNGTFGAGGSVRVEGGADKVNYAALSNQAGSALDITAAAAKVVAENVTFTRPRVTAGDGTTSLAVQFLLTPYAPIRPF